MPVISVLVFNCTIAWKGMMILYLSLFLCFRGFVYQHTVRILIPWVLRSQESGHRVVLVWRNRLWIARFAAAWLLSDKRCTSVWLLFDNLFVCLGFRRNFLIFFPSHDQCTHSLNTLTCAGWPRHRENRGFGSYFFQTGKTQGILLWHREKNWDTGKIFFCDTGKNLDTGKIFDCDY